MAAKVIEKEFDALAVGLSLLSLLGGLSSTLIAAFNVVVHQYTKADFITAVSNQLFSSAKMIDSSDDEQPNNLDTQNTDRPAFIPNQLRQSPLRFDE